MIEKTLGDNDKATPLGVDSSSEIELFSGVLNLAQYARGPAISVEDYSCSPCDGCSMSDGGCSQD